MKPVRVGAVSYLNAKPLVWGLQALGGDIGLRFEVPSRLPSLLAAGEIDVALLPVAALTRIEGARVICPYGIGADGPVDSVALFADVPMEQIDEVLLDDQSCTSVALVQLLLRDHWRRPVRLLPAQAGYIDQVGGRRAGVIIGDRAMTRGRRFAFKWDLAQAWKEATGLPFVFAAWVAVRPLPAGWLKRFEMATAQGLDRLDAVAAEQGEVGYDLASYYSRSLRYRLDAPMLQGLALFLERLLSLPARP